MNERTDERVAQYLRLYSCLFQTTVASAFTGDDLLLYVTLHCRLLRSLDVSWTNVSDKTLSALVWACPNLRSVDVNGCTGVTDQGVSAVVDALGGGGGDGNGGSGNGGGGSEGDGQRDRQGTMKGGVLRRLDISGCVGVTAEAFQRLVDASSASLQHLGVGGLFRLPHSALLSQLPRFTQLTSLHLRNSKQMRDSVLKKISTSCGMLEDLRLGGCGLLTDEGIIHAAHHFAHFDQAEAEAKEAPRSKSLKALSTTAASTSCSKTRGRLRRLELAGCVHIGDDAVRALVNSDLPLEALDVSGTGVTAKGIQLLANFLYRTLKELRCNFLKEVADGSCFTKLVRHCRKLTLLETVGVKMVGGGGEGGGVGSGGNSDGGGRGGGDGGSLVVKWKEINPKLVIKCA